MGIRTQKLPTYTYRQNTHAYIIKINQSLKKEERKEERKEGRREEMRKKKI